MPHKVQKELQIGRLLSQDVRGGRTVGRQGAGLRSRVYVGDTAVLHGYTRKIKGPTGVRHEIFTFSLILFDNYTIFRA